VLSKLPIHFADLPRQRTIQRDRIEYEADRNPDAIPRTLCAFAKGLEGRSYPCYR
jgi:ATP-dependent DNA helicase RecG